MVGVNRTEPSSGFSTTSAPPAHVFDGLGWATVITETRPVDVSVHEPPSAGPATAVPLITIVIAPTAASCPAILRLTFIVFSPVPEEPLPHMY
ncbi:hypothetical protein GCM10023084_67460 [Streptomyces lacrimifluminis]|uniref:Uncharacterized protein n=1 Tax=Streptomyces lacrimifluminis TaxID=1500077 RepID=A0A917L4V8_9ACTN|nr:hypothetical protein GCM10012282_44940 [Streptomyces lacrimifluminis]